MLLRGKAVGLAGLLTLVAALAPADALAFDLVEGVWTSETTPAGQILIEPNGRGGFKSTAITNSPAGACRPDRDGSAYREGLVKAEDMRPSGPGTYSGTTHRFNGTTCAVIANDVAAWQILSTSPTFRLRTCGTTAAALQFDAAGNPIPPTQCTILKRIRAPVRPPKPTDILKPPKPKKNRACGTRKLKISIIQPKNETLAKVVVKFDGKVKRTLVPPKIPRPNGKVKIAREPQSAYKVTLVATTASGRELTRKVTYKKCVKRKTSG